jgi:membrane protein implicated in regulation of membrane protease activity
VDPWLWWLVVAVLLAIAELFTGTFVLLMISAGAFGATLAAALGAPPVIQILVFTATSGLGLLGVRPALRRRLDTGLAHPEKFSAGIEGAECEVLERVDLSQGLVRIGGQMWRARPYDATQVLEPGERVRVIEVKGATALVWRE